MQLKPVLGPVQLIFYSVGVIVGAGVYSVLGAAAGLAQYSLWISFLVGAGVALLTAISYAEMATSFPAAGAEYVYIRRAWPKADWLAFGVGAIILIGGAATAATVAMAFGGYLRVFVDLPPPIAALLLLAGCTAFNVWGLRESSWVNILFTSIEVVGLFLVIVAALMSEARMPVAAVAAESSVMAAAALLFFVYLGFEEIAIFLLDRPRLAKTADTLRARSRAFGEGLQLVNILKDADVDAREGRIYIPEAQLEEVMTLAREDLRAATEYTLALQERGTEVGLVTFNALLVRLALGTLAAIRDKRPGNKLTRPQVMAVISDVLNQIDRGAPALPAARRTRSSRPRSERAPGRGGAARRLRLGDGPARSGEDPVLPAAALHDRPERGQHLRFHAGLPARRRHERVGPLHLGAERELEQRGGRDRDGSLLPFPRAVSLLAPPGVREHQDQPIDLVHVRR